MVYHPRARRRAHLARYKAKARKLYPHDPQATLANHLAVCSCPMCGNPRRHFQEKTRQERTHLLDFHQQIKDL
jgi:hypothetical protein